MTEQKAVFVDEVSEEMAQFIAESLNGGEFDDGKWYTDEQRKAWLRAVRPWAEEIVELQGRIGKLHKKILVWGVVKEDD